MKAITLSLAAATMLFASCSETDKTGNVTGDGDTAVFMSNKDGVKGDKNIAAAGDAWADVDWNSPVVKYDEVGSKDIETRGNDSYGIYSLGENILFASGSADLMPKAEDNLKQVWTSIQQRYANGSVRVYGYTDAKGEEDKNAMLSKQRAEAVKSWIMKNGNVAEDKISVQARGESAPVASNETAAGREQNRRVEIVARK